MSNWPVWRGSGHFTATGKNAATSSQTAVTASASINTKGAWAALTTSTPEAMSGCYLQIRCLNANRYLYDLSIGASGNEANGILIGDFLTGDHLNFGMYLPLAIPKGSRVSMRTQSTSASAGSRAGLIATPTHPWLPKGYSRWKTYGVTTGTTSGIALDGGGTAHTLSAWSDITTSTTEPINLLYVLIGRSNTAATATTDLLLDIGLWDGSAYQMLIQQISLVHLNGGQPFPAIAGPFPVDLPTGTRLGVRIQASSTDAGGRTCQVALLAAG